MTYKNECAENRMTAVMHAELLMRCFSSCEEDQFNGALEQFRNELSMHFPADFLEQEQQEMVLAVVEVLTRSNLAKKAAWTVLRDLLGSA